MYYIFLHCPCIVIILFTTPLSNFNKCSIYLLSIIAVYSLYTIYIPKQTRSIDIHWTRFQYFIQFIQHIALVLIKVVFLATLFNINRNNIYIRSSNVKTIFWLVTTSPPGLQKKHTVFLINIILFYVLRIVPIFFSTCTISISVVSYNIYSVKYTCILYNLFNINSNV